MCGIAGILLAPNASVAASEQREQARVALGRMVNAIRHRGPDDCGEITFNNRAHGVLGLGHTRLSIIDLSAAGHQPMFDPPTGNYITFNGEIYNYRELKQTLTSEFADWQSQTDTEVILKAYRKWGVECVQHLRGMFAFALWDAAEERLFIARDRLGIKPLYYFSRDQRFIFASEVRALLASELAPRRLDHQALNDYLSYQSIPAPRTLIEGVQALPPGWWLTVERDGRSTTGEYWNLLQNRAATARTDSREEARRKIGELLREAVELHLVSDVPLGVFLSGGIDSSALVALMRELGVTAKTFSVVFNEAAFDEARYARQVAARFQAEHTEIRLTEDVMLAQLPDSLAAMDQPTGDGVNTYLVAKAVKEAGITVALSGLGGDEFFAGYPSFKRLERATKYLDALASVPSSAKNWLAGLVRLLGRQSIRAAKTAALIESDGSLAEMYPVVRRVLSTAQQRQLLGERAARGASAANDPYVELLRAAYGQAEETGLLTRISYAEGRTYMHDLLLRDTDQMSMAHALEARVPLLDHKLIEYVMGLPDDYKRNNGTPKALLVESLGGLLPREIVQRPKQGFTLPFARWMLGALRAFCEERLQPERIRQRGVFDVDEVQRLWRAFTGGSRRVSWSRLWVLVVLEEWLTRHEITN